MKKAIDAVSTGVDASAIRTTESALKTETDESISATPATTVDSAEFTTSVDSLISNIEKEIDAISPITAAQLEPLKITMASLNTYHNTVSNRIDVKAIKTAVGKVKKDIETAITISGDATKKVDVAKAIETIGTDISKIEEETAKLTNSLATTIPPTL